MKRSWQYGLFGMFLGLGSPAGWFVLRLFSSFQGHFLQWSLEELVRSKWIYLYTGIVTTLAFTLFGYFLGKRNDLLDQRARALEKNAHTLERLSITDSLTNLYVHGYLIKRLEEEWMRAKRYDYSLGCLFIDVDDFKSLNECYGHLFGDRVLRQVAKVIADTVRDTDISGRYGGDEFLVILPEIGGEEVAWVAERIRKGVSALFFSVSSKETIHVTVSIGIYASGRLPSSPEILLELADIALLQAKIYGKNRSVPLVPKEGGNALRIASEN